MKSIFLILAIISTLFIFPGCATDGQSYELKTPSFSFPVGKVGTGYVYGGIGFKGNSDESLTK